MRRARYWEANEEGEALQRGSQGRARGEGAARPWWPTTARAARRRRARMASAWPQRRDRAGDGTAGRGVVLGAARRQRCPSAWRGGSAPSAGKTGEGEREEEEREVKKKLTAFDLLFSQNFEQKRKKV